MKTLLGFLALCLVVSTVSAESPKNILLILADDLGWADTTLYGETSLYETPNLERLAARGMTFSNAYAASPICSPTRASILTGQNPARHGMTAPAAHLPEVRFDPVALTNGPPHQKCTNVKSATRLDPSIPTLAQQLKDGGYSTAHFGKWHLGLEPHSPLELGFDVDIPHWHGPGPKTSYLAPWGYENPDFEEGEPGEHIEDRMAEEAVTWLKNRDKTKPFFLNYWQFSVHAPFGAKPELIDRYRPKIDRASEQQSPTYAAMVHSLDDAVGVLLDALEAEGILDETIIVFTSDNGGNIHCGLEETDATGEKYVTAITSNHPLRGGKGGIHEGGIRVPAVVTWPGVTEPGSRSEVRIQSNDFYPTILRMLDIEWTGDHAIDGIDFTRALRGEAMEREPMFTFVPGHGNTPQWLPPSMAVHHGDWKLIRTFHYGENGDHAYRLYHLGVDIGETHSLAAERPDKVQELDQLIEDYLAEAEVVVPLPNPNFDPDKFDPTTIGVQAGGLKMPRAKPEAGAPMPVTTVSKESMLGWTAKGAEISVEEGVLRMTATSRQPFLAHAKMRMEGPVQARFRVRAREDGTIRWQWRTEGQELFPKTGQSKSFRYAGGDWQEVSLRLPVEGQLVHLRFFPPPSKQPVEIDWIEIESAAQEEKERWDFDAVADSTKPKTARAVPGRPMAKAAKVSVFPKGKRPNILLILADDLGYGELGSYGSPDVKTPNMDRLAAEGVRCTDDYAAFPVCSPSRAAILTGRYPQRYGDTYEDYYGGGSPSLDPDAHPTIGQLLREAGYRTACFGKWNVSNLERRRANDFGFDSWVGLHLNHDFYTHELLRTGELDMYRDGEPYPDRVGTWSDTVFADEAIEFIKADDEKPFFIFLPFQAPHTPIQDPDVPMDEPQEKNRPTLIKMIERLDWEVGRVLQALEDQDVSEDTLVILTSDNGGEQKIARNLPLGGAKQSLNEGGVRVPYLLRWPGVLPEGKVFKTPVSAYDLTATVAAAGGAVARPGKPFDGVDLVPVMTGAGDLSADRPLFFRRRNITVQLGENGIRQSAVRQGDWKYLRTYKPVGSDRYQQALYLLSEDIGEENNLAGSHPERTEELSQLLDQWEEEVDATGLAFEDVPRVKKRGK